MTANGGLFGAIFGLISVVLYGMVTSDLQTGIDYLTNPVNDVGLANLDVFLSALLGSALVTILVSEVENAQSWVKIKFPWISSKLPLWHSIDT